MNTSDNTAGARESDATAPASSEQQHRVLTGTVVWGVILLIVAAIYALDSAAELELIQITLSPAWIVLTVGALCVVGGIIAAVSRKS